MMKRIFNRQARGGSRELSSSFRQHRALSIEFSNNKTIKSAHESGVASLALDAVENRYLLAGALDTSIAVYDVLQQHNEGVAVHHPLLKIDSRSREGHKFSVSAVAWYPIDSGLFITGSFDKQVKVWDTNTSEAACSFAFPGRVFAVAMSPASASHSLVAVSGDVDDVQLADPMSGGFVHTLQGHRGGAWALHWSSEWHLMSGGCDGQVRIWDIRRMGAAWVLDQHCTAQQSRTPSRPALTEAQPHARKRRHLERSREDSPPPLLAETQHATAHDGRVTSIVPTPDGLFWLTAGTDSRVRLWDAQQRRNVLVNYAQTFNSSTKGRQMAVCGDGRLLFHPSGSVIQVLHIHSGRPHKLLRGHYDTVNCCCYNPLLQELYSGSNDTNILVWNQPTKDELEDDSIDRDNWSGDENDQNGHRY